ncbi:MAG: hypothetical protein IKI09_01470 [Bacteroidales bacterium]|nr:hypothetical protein [Bacteroidales bacterium]
MNNSNKNDAIEVMYHALNNKTYEFLDEAVIHADIMNKNGLSSLDTIIDLKTIRYYDGKELNQDAKIGFNIVFVFPLRSEPTNKIVIMIDGERLEIDTMHDDFFGKKETELPPGTIIGMNPRISIDSNTRSIDFTLQPNDIKRIAEANDVGLYVDSMTLYDVNGGEKKYRKNDKHFQIEGIQGAMKRAYHYFVDETCYVDYCASYLKKKQKVLAEEEKRENAEKQKQEQLILQQEQAEQEAIARWYRNRNITIVVLVLSIVAIILGYFVESLWWLIFVSIFGISFSWQHLKNLHGVSDDDDNVQ